MTTRAQHFQRISVQFPLQEFRLRRTTFNVYFIPRKFIISGKYLHYSTVILRKEPYLIQLPRISNDPNN